MGAATGKAATSRPNTQGDARQLAWSRGDRSVTIKDARKHGRAAENGNSGEPLELA